MGHGRTLFRSGDVSAYALMLWRAAVTARAGPGTGSPRGWRDAGQGHDQAVDADAEATGGRHAVLERDEEVLIGDFGLVVALGAEAGPAR